MFSAMLYGYADRNYYLGDPDFIDIPVKRLISKNYAAEIRAKIPDNLAIDPEKVNLIQSSEGNHTTHYSVVDKNGNAVAVTYTINSYFGAGVMAENTGFLLNNEMNDFTAKLGKANIYGLVQGNNNKIEPGKRPLSSMTPTIILKDGKVIAVTGSPGGPTIITTVLQVITNSLDYNLTPEQSVNSPRFHYQGEPKFVLIEKGATSLEAYKQLEKMGYKIKENNRRWGAAESIFIDPDTGNIEGVNDKRRSVGQAVGVSVVEKERKGNTR
jgi:gamma-glutamyltranspeptidase/glutathione hydrolase